MTDLQTTLQMSESERLASEFLVHIQQGVYLRDHIARLVEMALSPDEITARSATRAIFTSLVERLADSFDPAAASLYNRLFAQAITLCRSCDQGRELDDGLNGFGLGSEEDLIERAESLPSFGGSHLPGKCSPEMIVVLSRVTIGADVAITSVIIERMKREFPDARIALVGGGKASELFGGEARLSFHQIDYRRAGSMIERLLNWIELLKCIRALTEGLNEDEYLIVDPDSRLTQLGLLPVAPDESYLFFPSREYGSSSGQSLSELASRWLDEVFGKADCLLPRLSLARADLESARDVSKQIKQADSRPVVAINLGVGENPAKRIGDVFERSLVTQMILDGAAVILDRGAGEDEMRRADRVIRSLLDSKPDARVVEIDEENLKGVLHSNRLVGVDLVVWRGRIGLLAALIGESAIYIGYDSAGQHIAAALSVPCIDVMAGYTSPGMIDRWRPTGSSRVRLISVDTLNADADERAILADVLACAREILSR